MFSPSRLWNIIDLDFAVQDRVLDDFFDGEVDPILERHFEIERTIFWSGGYSADISITVYGGANERAIEFDDPRPIDNRGYWFNGEC